MAPQRISPWTHVANELRAEARKHAMRDMQLGLKFRATQEEAYAAWAAWDEALLPYRTREVEDTSAQYAPQPIKDLATLKGNQLTVLVLTLLNKQHMYIYQICQAVRERGNGQYDLKFSTLYPLTHGLERNGIIEGYWRTSPDGTEQKYFRLTPKGSKVLEREKNTSGAIETFLPGWQTNEA